ncbi:MAG: hypothetical protein IPJ41_02320 [Phycisphaerales bacterium]|nr:hypothetical protein [Phycisphaerales bacterium]
MHRAAMIAIPCLAALFASGCYHYDARATNLSGQDVQVSLHKGKKQVELSSVSLPTGRSINWEGTTNGPVLLRFEAIGQTADVRIPRRKHAELAADTTGGSLTVTKQVDGVEACCTDEDCTCSAGDAGCADCRGAEGGNPEGSEPESIDLVEPEKH